MNTTYVTAEAMIEFLTREARNHAAIANETHEFALRAITEVGPGFEYSIGTQTWKVEG